MKSAKTLKRVLSLALSSIGMLAVIIGFMLISVGFCVYNKNFYDAEFSKNASYDQTYDTYTFSKGNSGTLVISTDELFKVRDKIIAYFSGTDESLQIEVFFNGSNQKFFTDFETEGKEDNEIAHMEDVKPIFIAVKILGYVLAILGVLVLIGGFFLTEKGYRLRVLCRGAIIGASIFLLIIGTIGLYIAIDFNTAFTVFHHIFFPQGNWTFSITSNMLAILPEVLFLDAAITIISCGVGLAIILLITGIIGLRLNKKRTKYKTNG